MIRRAGWHTVSLALAVPGLLVAGYLTYSHYDTEALVCTVGDCKTVQNSPYAEIAGIPISILGMGMYLGVVALGALRSARPAWASTATMAAFALVLSGAVYAAYLTYLEIAVIKAICQWCVTSAVLTLGILAAESVLLWRILGTGGEPAGLSQ